MKTMNTKPELPPGVEIKDVSRNNNYQVTSDGRVWSKPRMARVCGGGQRLVRGKWIKQSAAEGGYLKVGLYSGGKGRTVHVHALVATAFLGERPEGMEVDHISGDRVNNCSSNLRYTTRLRNAHNTRAKGCYQLEDGKWFASICFKYKQRRLGTFITEGEARAAYLKAKREGVEKLPTI